MTNQTGNGNGSLFYDENRKKWRLQISYYTPTGELKRKSFSGSKKEVQQKKKAFERDLALNQITETSFCTIVDILKEDAEYDLSIGEIIENSYVRRLFVIKILEKHPIGTKSISEINEKIIKDFLLSLRSVYSNSVIGKVYSAMKKAYKIAVNKHIVPYNLMDSPFVKKPKSTIKDKKITAFTCEEQQKFIDALKNKKFENNRMNYKPIFFIALYTGMRMGEILALTKEDIDFENNLIRVNKTITRGIDYEIKLGENTKTEAGNRNVPISDFLKPILKDVVNQYRQNKDHLLFYNFKMNQPISTQNVNCSFKRICKSIGIKPTGGQHLLRHTFVTRCIEADIPIDVIMHWVGHKDITTTINTYADVLKSRSDKSFDKLTDYYGKTFIV